ncbi:MAG: YbaK/aminoacyl-tRNA synthetase-associated domain-containing protein [Monoraphidium minutum]|nr:MAG: YbaK/aminoacyl-tRNA synthetase-associated domain-containing protein [Monoraphidium minutum]
MAQTKESVLAILKDNGVQFELFEHEPVMTCEAQAAALAHTGGKVTKSLFLRDKKKRTYVVTALPETAINLKILPGRLGLGSGNIAFGPEDALAASLAVAPGCVTPLALANAGGCAHTLLLLDEKLRGAGKFFVHPIVNSASVMLDAAGLEAFLRAIGREPIWVDLEAAVKISPDSPPDLKQYVDAVPPPPKASEGGAAAAAPAASSSSGGAAGAGAGGGAKPAAAGGGGKPHAKRGAGASASAGKVSDGVRHIELTDVEARADELISLVCASLIGAPPADAAAAAGGGAPEGAYVLARLKADVEVALGALKNAAYTAGYGAGKAELVAAATRRFA